MKRFYPNPKTRASNEPPKDKPKPVPPGALAKAWARMQDLANATIAAITNFNNARRGMNELYWRVQERLDQFNHNRLYLLGALLLTVAAIVAEVSISLEFLQTLTVAVAGVLVASIALSGIAGTALLVRGVYLWESSTSRAAVRIVLGLGLLVAGGGAVLYFSHARTQYYASYGDPRQYTTLIPFLLYVVECACGWFAELYLNYLQLQREQRAIIREWDKLLEIAQKAQRATRQAWVEYAKVFEEKHGSPPDLQKEGSQQIIYVLEVTLTERGNFDDEDDDKPAAASPAPDPVPVEPDAPRGQAPAAKQAAQAETTNGHGTEAVSGTELHTKSDEADKEPAPQRPWEQYQDEIDLHEIHS
jgi:hypothetical protein